MLLLHSDIHRTVGHLHLVLHEFIAQPRVSLLGGLQATSLSHLVQDSQLAVRCKRVLRELHLLHVVAREQHVDSLGVDEGSSAQLIQLLNLRADN